MMLITETYQPKTINIFDISTLITTFYARVRADQVLGPVFMRTVPESHWAKHLDHISTFWSSVMLSTGNYHGKPVQMHAKHLDAITPIMFTRWLELWTLTTQELFTPSQANLFIHKATQIANSLQFALFESRPTRYGHAPSQSEASPKHCSLP